MKRLTIVLIIMMLGSVCSYAIPAYPYKVKVTQPDGSTLIVKAHGDEYGHWFTDESGTVMQQYEDGWFRPLAGVTQEQLARRAAENRAAKNKVSNAAGSMKVKGKMRFLTILVEFSDVAFKTDNPKQAVHDMLNQENYSVNGATGSARDYFYENSLGQFEPVFDVYGPAKLSQPMQYYGGNDSRGDDLRPHYALREGCQLLKDEIDFSQYDSNNDGDVDMVLMIYAGYGEADGGGVNTIWPHEWNIRSGGLSFSDDGKNVDVYACTNELSSIGPTAGKLNGIGAACHEFGHAIGLPDMYDTDYTTNGYASALLSFSVMDSGTYNNVSRTPPYLNMQERALLGWAGEGDIRRMPSSGTVEIPPVRNNVAYMTPTDMDGEYFLYECRTKTGWDAYIPGEGMIVYHADKSSRGIMIDGLSKPVSASDLWRYWESYNALNENGSHPCFYIVPAGDQENLAYEKSGSAIPFPGSKNIKTYRAKSWNGVLSDYELSDIAFSGEKVSFSVKGYGNTTILDFNVIANPGNGKYSAGDRFDFLIKDSETRPYDSVSWFFDGAPTDKESVILSAGHHTVEAELKLKNGKTSIVTLELNVR